MRNKARLWSALSRSSTRRSGYGEHSRQWSNNSRAKKSAEVFSNQQLQLLPRGFGNGLAVGDQSVGQRRSALAFATGRHARNGGGHHFARVVGILAEVSENVSDGDGIVLFVPAIVVGDHRDRNVTDLGLARELGLLEVGHTDDVHAPAAINIRFRFGGKSRALHT